MFNEQNFFIFVENLFFSCESDLKSNILNEALELMTINRDKRDSFIKSYRIYYPLVFNRIYRITNSREDTEDICHEVFIEFFNKIDSVKEPRNWLMTVARNQTGLFYRKRKIKLDVSLDTVDTEKDTSLSFVNGEKEVRFILQEEINKQENFEDDIDRTVFDLIAVLKYSYKEAAVQLNMTRRQVVYRYEKIIKKMLVNLRQKGIQSTEDLL